MSEATALPTEPPPLPYSSGKTSLVSAFYLIAELPKDQMALHSPPEHQ